MPDISAFGAPIAVVAILVTIFLVGSLYVRNYIKVPPNQVAVFTGRGTPKIIRGGARFKIPGLERVDFMSLEPFNIQVKVTNAISKAGVPVSVEGVALVRFGSSEESIATATERFLTSDRDQLHRQLTEIISGGMRGICATMSVEELNSNREQLTGGVAETAGGQLAGIGMELDVLTIQNISDEVGYLDALGRKATAEVKRDAEVGEAEARRDAMVKSAEADRLGKTAEAVAAAQIAEAERERDIKLANIQTEVEAANARAALAGPQAAAEAQRAVVVAEVEAARTRVEAEIEVEELRSQRAERALKADVIAPAEAEREATIARAEGEKQATIARAQADAEARIAEGDAEAKARTSGAEALRAEKQAEADGVRAGLLAEAEGRKELAEALNAFTDEAARLSILPALIETLPEMAAAVAAPLSQIDRMVVIGGGNGNGSGGMLSSLGNMVPGLLTQTIEALNASGFDVAKMLNAQPDSTDKAAKPAVESDADTSAT